MKMMLGLLSAAMLLLLLPGTLTNPSLLNTDNNIVPFDLVVENNLSDGPPLLYNTHVVYRGILLGGLQRLMHSNADFTFNYTVTQNYGPYLESVNGLQGNDTAHTYWQLLVRTPDGKTKIPDVGIGCYIPSQNETIILNFTKW